MPRAKEQIAVKVGDKVLYSTGGGGQRTGVVIKAGAVLLMVEASERRGTNLVRPKDVIRVIKRGEGS